MRWRRWIWMRDGAAEESASSLCPAATLEGETLSRNRSLVCTRHAAAAWEILIRTLTFDGP